MQIPFFPRKPNYPRAVREQLSDTRFQLLTARSNLEYYRHTVAMLEDRGQRLAAEALEYERAEKDEKDRNHAALGMP